MKSLKSLLPILAGAAAGCLNGIFGAGGGMVLVPLLSASRSFTNHQIFASSIVIILPISIISLGFTSHWDLPWQEALPYLLGGTLGGIAAITLGRKIPVHWLHRILGIMILYGGFRYLW